MSKTSFRNREIFSAVQAGTGIDEIAALYGLTRTRVVAIMREEKLKRRYSPEEPYRQLRQQAR